MSVSRKLATHPITDTGKDACFSLLMAPSETPKSLCKKIYILCSQVKTGQTKNTGKPAEPEEEERRRPMKQDITENERMQRKPRS